MSENMTILATLFK